MTDHTGKILIIDDERFVRESMADYLADSGFEVIEAENGEQGLEKLDTQTPDLVFCDLLMPVMSGLDVLSAVAERNQETPVIIVSGAGSISDTVEAMKRGAWDYIIKPIHDMNVLVMAVNKALERKRLLNETSRYQRELEKANKELNLSLETLELTRDQLVQSEKMAALGGLVAGVAHEINTPVGIGVTAASFLEAKTKEIEKAYESGALKRGQLEDYLFAAKEAARSILINMERAAELISSFKQVAVDQSTQIKREFNLKEYINEVLVSLGPRYRKTGHRIQVDCDGRIHLNSYPGAVYQILNNLITNSLVHGFKDMDKGTIHIRAAEENGRVKLVYRDDGCGMIKDQQEKAFDPFFTTTRGKGGAGLGMSVVFNLVTRTLNGKVTLETGPEKGICVAMTFPSTPALASAKEI